MFSQLVITLEHSNKHIHDDKSTLPGTYISVMASGRWAGIAVRPRPRQSTMLLLQVHIGGQEPDARLHGWTKALPLWPADTTERENTNITHPATVTCHTWS